MWYSHHYQPTDNTEIYSCISGTLILHVDICFTKHCYCIYLWTYHTYPVLYWYYYFHHQILLHGHHLCLLHVPLIHGYTNSLDIIIVTWMLCTQLYHVHISLLHVFTGIHAFIIFIFLSCGSLFILHGLLLHVYYCILVTWLFPVTDIDISAIGHECCWYMMCGTKCHVDPSHGGHL